MTKDTQPLKTYALIDPETGQDQSDLTNQAPRNAAMKAVSQLRRAGKDFNTVILREKGTAHNGEAAIIHVFRGSSTEKNVKLPLPIQIRSGIEKRAGKKITDEMNIEGNEKALEAAGFKLLVNISNVKKIGLFHVPGIEGKDAPAAIAEYIKTELPKTTI